MTEIDEKLMIRFNFRNEFSAFPTVSTFSYQIWDTKGYNLKLQLHINDKEDT